MPTEITDFPPGNWTPIGDGSTTGWAPIGDGSGGNWMPIATDFDFLVTDAGEYLVTDDGYFLIVADPQPPFWTVIGTGDPVPSYNPVT